MPPVCETFQKSRALFKTWTVFPHRKNMPQHPQLGLFVHFIPWVWRWPTDIGGTPQRSSKKLHGNLMLTFEALQPWKFWPWKSQAHVVLKCVCLLPWNDRCKKSNCREQDFSLWLLFIAGTSDVHIHGNNNVVMANGAKQAVECDWDKE